MVATPLEEEDIGTSKAIIILFLTRAVLVVARLQKSRRVVRRDDPVLAAKPRTLKSHHR